MPTTLETLNTEEDLTNAALDDYLLSGEGRESHMSQGLIKKKAATAAAIAPNGDPADTFETIKNDLNTAGSSRLLEDIDAEERQIQEELAREEAVELSLQASAEGKSNEQIRAEHDQFKKLQEERPTASHSEVLVFQTLANMPMSKTKGLLMKDAGQIAAHQDLVNQMVDLQRSKLGYFSDKPIENTARWMLSAWAPGWTVILSGLMEEMTPGSTSLWNLAFPGEVVKSFMTEYDNALIEDKLEIIHRLGSAVEEHTGLLVEDNSVAKDFLEMLVRNSDPTTDEIRNEGILASLIGVADLIPFLGSAVKKSAKVYKKISDLRLTEGGIPADSLVSVVNKIDPEMTKEVVTEAIHSQDDKFLESIGVTKEQILLDMALPMPDGTKIRSGVSLTSEDLRLRVIEEKGEGTHGINYTPTETEVSKENLKETLETINEITSTVNISRTKIRNTTGGFNAQVAIGRSSTKGFDTIDEAVYASEQYLEHQVGAKARYYKVNRVLGQYDELSEIQVKQLANDGVVDDYIFTLDIQHKYGKGDTLGFDEGAVVGASGEGAKYLDISTVFNSWLVRAINRSGDTPDVLKADLQETLKPLTKLSSFNQRPILDIIDEGALFDNIDGTVGKWFTKSELQNNLHFKGIPMHGKRSEKLIAAYDSYKLFQDKMFILNDGRIRKGLTDEGYKSVTLGARVQPVQGVPQIVRASEQVIGKPILDPRVQRQVQKAYNQDTGLIDDFTPFSVDTLYANGKQLVKLKFPKSISSGETTTYAIVAKKVGDSISDLPPVILKRLPGYKTTIYNTTHLVKAHYTVVEDGIRVPKTKVISLESNPRAANKAKLIMEGRVNINNTLNERFTSDLPTNTRYTVERADEVQNVDYANGTSPDYFHDRGQMFFSPKSKKELTNMAGDRVVKDLGESINIAIDNVSKHVGMDDLIGSLIKRWEETYAADFGFKANKDAVPVFPGTRDITRSNDISKRRAENDAIALKDRINLIRGTDKDSLDMIHEKIFIRGSEWVADKTADSGAYWNTVIDKFIGARDSSLAHPIRTAKNLAFLKWIVAMPVKQAWMQGNTASMALGMDDGIEYFATRGIPDIIGLATGLNMKVGSDTWKVLAPKNAKAMGLTVDEYESFLDAYKATGGDQAVASHAYVADMALTDTIAGKGVLSGVSNDIANLFKALARGSRDVGFGAGERFNFRVAGFLMARERWLNRYTGTGNPHKEWLKKDNLDQIAAAARELTLNMSQVGSTALQRGALGAIFQFTSHPHKAMQAILPDVAFLGKVSGKTFENREKARLAVTQFFLYGTIGIPLLKEAVDFIIETSELVLDKESVETREQVEEGLISTALVHAVDVATGSEEESHSAISQGIAPFTAVATGGNSPIHKTIRAIYDTAQGNYLSAARELMPPGFKATSDIGKSIVTMAWLAGGVDLDESDPNRMKMIIEEGLRIAPQLDKIFSAKLAYKTGVLINKYGDPQDKHTLTELILHATVGAPDKDLLVIKELSRKIKGVGFGRESDPAGESIKVSARWLYNQQKAYTAKYVENPTGGFKEFADSVERSMSIFKFVYDDREMLVLQKSLKSLRAADNNQTVPYDLGDEVSKAISSGKLGSSDPIVTNALNTFFMQDKPAFRQRVQQSKELESANTTRLEQENL